MLAKANCCMVAEKLYHRLVITIGTYKWYSYIWGNNANSCKLSSFMVFPTIIPIYNSKFKWWLQFKCENNIENQKYNSQAKCFDDVQISITIVYNEII